MNGELGESNVFETYARAMIRSAWNCRYVCRYIKVFFVIRNNIS